MSLTDDEKAVQRQLQIAIEQANRGECVPFNADEVIREGRIRLEQKKNVERRRENSG